MCVCCQHLLGGLCGLIGARITGPRHDIVSPSGNLSKPEPHLIHLSGIGCLFLWLGFHAFNAGAALSITQRQYETVASVVLNTALCGAMSGVLAPLHTRLSGKRTNAIDVMNCILTGLVSSTSCSAYVDPLMCIVISEGACLFYFSGEALLHHFVIDDAISAFPIHGMGGIWSLLCAGLFANTSTFKGLLYGDPTQFAIQLLAVVLIIAIVSPLSLFAFFIINRTLGLRVPLERELQGLDAQLGMKMNIDMLAIKKFLVETNGFDILLTKASSPVIEALRTFLVQHKANHSLDFLLGVQQYKRMWKDRLQMFSETVSDDSLRENLDANLQSLFNDLYYQFCAPEAYRRINLTTMTKRRLDLEVNSQTKANAGGPLETAFDWAYFEVAQSIKNEHWKQFVDVMFAGTDLPAVKATQVAPSSSNDGDAYAVPMYSPTSVFDTLWENSEPCN